MRIPALLLLPVLAPGAALADADRTPALRTGPAVSIQGYGPQNPTCLEWTDGCIACASRDGHARCSTPGIACMPGGVVCKRHAAP